MKMLKYLLPNHIIARIMKEAIGVDLMTVVIGESRALIMGSLDESAAKTVPKTSAATKPDDILMNEKPKARHISGVKISSQSLFAT